MARLTVSDCCPVTGRDSPFPVFERTVMAVAVKTSPGSRSSGSLANPAILSLVGVLYLLGCLGIVFGLIPSLWWSAWESLGLGKYQVVGGSLLLLIGLAVGVGL